MWIVHRNAPDLFGARTEIGAAQNPPVSECCIPAPPVLEFDAAGNLVGHWGGPSATGEYEWPECNHGIIVDHMDNVWIGGNGGPDSHVLKFTRDGKFVWDFGHRPPAGVPFAAGSLRRGFAERSAVGPDASRCR